jgi:hypothetical protein
MIDVAKEKLISLTQAADLLPRNPNGSHVHINTLMRWAFRGVDGVMLDVWGGGGGKVWTSTQALSRFGEARAKRRRQAHREPPTVRGITEDRPRPRLRVLSHGSAVERLKAVGI